MWSVALFPVDIFHSTEIIHATSPYQANSSWTFLLLEIYTHDQSSRAYQVQWKLIHRRALEMISIRLCNCLRVYQNFMKWFKDVNAKHIYCHVDWLENLHLYKSAVQDCDSIDDVLVLFQVGSNAINMI